MEGCQGCIQWAYIVEIKMFAGTWLEIILFLECWVSTHSIVFLFIVSSIHFFQSTCFHNLCAVLLKHQIVHIDQQLCVMTFGFCNLYFSKYLALFIKIDLIRILFNSFKNVYETWFNKRALCLYFYASFSFLLWFCWFYNFATVWLIFSFWCSFSGLSVLLLFC